jgi:hypothetical protein
MVIATGDWWLRTGAGDGIFPGSGASNHLLTLALVCFFTIAPSSVDAAGWPESTTLIESFDGGKLDSSNWMIDPMSPPGVKFDLVADGLRIRLPPGTHGRPPAVMQSRFEIEGNFDIRLSYRIGSLPKPKREWSNIEIYIDGQDGQAAVIRTNHAEVGPGYTLWYGPPKGSNKKGAWKHIPNRDDVGTLRLERSGRRLRFEAGYRPDGLREIGEVDFGDGTVEKLQFRLLVPETQADTDVAFEDVRVRADRLIGAPPPSKTMFGPRAWLGVVLVLLAASSVGIWIRGMLMA